MLSWLFRPRLSASRLWAVAAGGTLSRFHREPLDRLQVQHRPKVQRRMLVPNWHITSRESSLHILHWLATEGHNVSWVGLCNHIADPDARRSPRCPARIVEFVRTNMPLGSQILAYDMDRLVSVARWCRGAEYITEAEAWQYMLYAAKMAQAHFSSWVEYAANYALGYNFWAETVDDHSLDGQVANAQKWLLQCPESPWRRLSWHTPLE